VDVDVLPPMRRERSAPDHAGILRVREPGSSRGDPSRGSWKPRVPAHSGPVRPSLSSRRRLRRGRDLFLRSRFDRCLQGLQSPPLWLARNRYGGIPLRPMHRQATGSSRAGEAGTLRGGRIGRPGSASRSSRVNLRISAVLGRTHPSASRCPRLDEAWANTRSGRRYGPTARQGVSPISSGSLGTSASVRVRGSAGRSSTTMFTSAGTCAG
jgi:hypothetical protein